MNRKLSLNNKAENLKYSKDITYNKNILNINLKIFKNNFQFNFGKLEKQFDETFWSNKKNWIERNWIPLRLVSNIKFQQKNILKNIYFFEFFDITFKKISANKLN